ncbi:MAG TPA: RHS repeat-associated core domain-containing protein, partial [Candidatus Cryosericum sp.]
ATFAWDLLDRASQVTDPQNHVTSYTYDTVGRRLSMLCPNALSTQYTYDASSRITQLRLVNTTTNTELLNTATTYDANGNALTSGPDTYTYDSTQQLASWTRSGVQTSYTYDARGNLTGITGPSGTTSFTVDPATNRLLSVTVPGGSTDTWTYDAAGNPLTRTRSQNGTTQVSSYTWDATGKLSSVIRQGGTTLTFAYAPDGTLTRKEQGTQVTTYAYDFAGVSREATGSSAVTYQHGGAGELVSLTWNNQTYYYHFNAHGDTIALSDGTGTLVAQYSYDPWGALTTNTNPSIPNSYLYCGAYGVHWDADLGLYLMGARWYNPSTGRFLTKDSYPADLLAPLTQNPYQYCGNNPVNNVDPAGKDPMELVGLLWTDWGSPEDLSTMLQQLSRDMWDVLCIGYESKWATLIPLTDGLSLVGVAAGEGVREYGNCVQDQIVLGVFGGLSGLDTPVNTVIPSVPGVVDVQSWEATYQEGEGSNKYMLYTGGIVLHGEGGKVLWSGGWSGRGWMRIKRGLVPPRWSSKSRSLPVVSP